MDFVCAPFVVVAGKITTVNFSFVGAGSCRVVVINPDGSPGAQDDL